MRWPFAEARGSPPCGDFGAPPVFKAGGVVRRVGGVPRARVQHNSVVRLRGSLYDPLGPKPAAAQRALQPARRRALVQHSCGMSDHLE